MRRWRVLAAILGVLLLLGAGGLAGGGWYLSDVLKQDALLPNHEPAPYDMRVAAVGEGLVTLSVTPQTDEGGPWKSNGTWGLTWEGGYGQVGAIRELGAQQAVRDFRPLQGTLSEGQMARLDSFAFPGNPREAYGMNYEEVSYSSPLGMFTAWSVAGSNDTWAIFVHGRNATPREALRLLPAVVKLGLPALVITYRNDEGAPPNPDGLLWYGLTEWQDLEGAAQYALQQGAKEFVLVGYSMGGAIVVNFLYQSPLSARVKGVILDAPMVDFSTTVDLGASRRGYPVLMATVAKGVAQLRFGLPWGDLDYVRLADRLKAPILLFHGDADTKVPVATSDALAEARPDLVKYMRVAGATHVGSWNLAPTAYEVTVLAFLAELMGK